MSGIGYIHNKFDSCEGCPDRVADPNCHDACKGYLYRQEEKAKQNAERQKKNEFATYKADAVEYTKRQIKSGNIRRRK